MRLTRFLLGCLGLLLGLAVAAAWLLPPRLDATRFQAPLQRLASRALGAEVRIAGPIRLRLLPQPTLAAGAVAVAAAQGDAALRAGGLRLRLALAPLLAGRLVARTLVLERPELALPPGFALRSLVAHRPRWLDSVSARIEDGRITVGGATLLQGLDASLEADPLLGDLVAAGRARLGPQAWRFDARVTRPGADGAAGLDMALHGLGGLTGTAVMLTAQLAADGSLGGRLAAHGADLSQLLPAPAQPFSAEGRVTFADGLAAADELAVELGGEPARGAVALRVAPTPRLDLALTATRIALDPWRAVLRRVAAGSAFGTLPLGIDLSAEAATLSGGTVRGLRLAVDLLGGAVAVRELRATLPGDATLRMAGTLRPGAAAAFTGPAFTGPAFTGPAFTGPAFTGPAFTGPAFTGPAFTGPAFTGEAALTAPALRATLAWAAPWLPPLAGLPPAVLQRADVSALVQADAGGARLDRLAGTLDSTAIGGSVAWRTAGAIVADLALQRLALDPWLAAAAGGADLDLRLRADQATLQGVTLAPLRLSLARNGGDWWLRELQATSAGGAVLGASGRLSAAGRLDDVRLTLAAPRLDAVPLLPELPAGAPLRRAALRATLAASGTRAALSAQLRASLGDMAFEADPTVDLDHATWSGAVVLRAPSARRMLAATALPQAAGLPTDTAWLGEGSLGLRVDASGAADAVTLANLDLVAGRLHATGHLHLAWGQAPDLSGALAAETLPLPPPAALLAAVLAAHPPARMDLQVRAGTVEQDARVLLAPFAATLAASGAAIRLVDVTAGFPDGGSLSGQASLDVAALPPRLRVSVTWRDVALTAPLPHLPVMPEAGQASGRADIEAQGHAPDALRATLGGAAMTTIAGGKLRGVALDGLPADLPRAAVAASLAGGATALSRADVAVSIADGIANVTTGRIAIPAGDLTLSGSVDLGQLAADLLLTFVPRLAGTNPAPPAIGPPPAIGLRLVGPLDRVQRIPQLADLARWHGAREQP